VTRAPGPASHEPVGPAGDDRETAVLPPVRAARRAGPAPAVPEVPAIADIAAPGRPDVGTVLTPEAPSARRRPRPSRRMRARADEMARVLSRAAPGASRRRGLSSVPAAAAVMAAVAVGGVGIALGLDAQRTGQQIALPEVPRVPAEQTPVSSEPVTDGAAAPTAGTSLLGAVERGDGDTARPSAEASRTSAAAPRATRGDVPAPGTTSRPRTTTPTTAGDPTTSRSTPRSTTPSPSTRADDDGARRDTDGDSRDLDDLGARSDPLDRGGTGAG
jgi:hypothetical protein